MQLERRFPSDKLLLGSSGASYCQSQVIGSDQMAFDETTAKRVRLLLSRRKGFEEKKMFGGIGFLLNGNMCCGVWKEFLILRVGPAAYQETLAQEFVKQFDIT